MVALLGAIVLAGCARSADLTNGRTAGGLSADSSVAASSSTPAAALPTCGTAPTDSNGPLAAITTLAAPTVTDSGIGGPPDDPPGYRMYDAEATLSVSASGPSLLMPDAWVAVLSNGAPVGLLAARTATQPEATDEVQVSPGVQTVGSGFQALGCDGNSLPAGDYQVVMQYAYNLFADPSAGRYQLVSPPTAWSLP